MPQRPDPSKTIAKHAKQYLINRYGESRCHFATSHRRQIGPNRFINAKEDLFGVFDAACIDTWGQTHYYQWTSVAGATARKRKIEDRFDAAVKCRPPTVVLGYVPRQGFRVWKRDGSMRWKRLDDIPLSACKKPV